MATAPPPPIIVLSHRVDTFDLTGEPEGDGWTKIECASKKAYGCGEHGQEAVEGLTLYVRLADDYVVAELALRISDAAIRRFDSELEICCPRRKDTLVRHPMRSAGAVLMADEEQEQGFTVIDLVIFSRNFRRDLAFFLVYDHIYASLSLIKRLPDLWNGAIKPVVARRHGGDFDLFLMAYQLYTAAAPRDILCVCTPETRASPSAPPDGPWLIKELDFPDEDEIQKPFNTDVAFSLQGKGFWADLSQGLMYCDLHTTSSDVDDDVDFGFIRLPRECQLGMVQDDVMMGEMMMMSNVPMKLTRTIGCVRGTIWFVCIDRANDYVDALVKIWALKVPEGKLQRGQWEILEEFTERSLWDLGSFKVTGLPKVPLLYPILTADGALCLLLAKQVHLQVQVEDCICMFRVRGKRGKKLLWHGRVHGYPFIDPVILPSNFPQREHGWHTMKVDEHRPAPGLAALACSKAVFGNDYNPLIYENKRESHQTPCLFSLILSSVVSCFRDLYYKKRKAKSGKIFA